MPPPSPSTNHDGLAGPSRRVLILATYFPKPGNEAMGTWAMSQAQALMRQGCDVTVVSPSPWLPRPLGHLPGGRLARMRSWATCPPAHDWGSLRAHYPRWLWYHVDPFRRWSRPNPAPQLELGWRSGQRAFKRLVEEIEPDLIYAHHVTISGYLALKLRRHNGVPYVLIEHDHGEIADCERFPERRRLYQEVIDSAQAVIAVASPMEAELRRLFPAARVRVVHNAADPFEPSRLDVPRPPETRGRIVVFSAAHLYHRKGMPVLIEAFARIADRHPGAVLRIVGDGEDRPAVDRAAAVAGLGDRLQLLGRAPHRTVLQEMAWADVFALIGWDEPHAIAYMEAMAAGKPVVWADDGGINDILKDGVHGYAVPPRDAGAAAQALDRLLGDEAGRRQMGEAGRELLEERYTWDANARALIGVFEQTADRVAAPAPA